MTAPAAGCAAPLLTEGTSSHIPEPPIPHLAFASALVRMSLSWHPSSRITLYAVIQGRWRKMWLTFWWTGYLRLHWLPVWHPAPGGSGTGRKPTRATIQDRDHITGLRCVRM